MKLHDIRLSTRIIFVTLLIVAVSAAVFLFFERAHHREVYINEQNADLEKNLQVEKLRLSQTIDTLRRDVLFLSNIPPVSGIMRATLNRGFDARDSNTRAKWEDRLNEIFSAFSAAHPDYYLISYIGVADGGKELGRVSNRDGRIDVTSPGKLAARGGRDYFNASLELQKGQIWLSEFDLSQDSGDPPKPTLRRSSPLREHYSAWSWSIWTSAVYWSPPHWVCHPAPRPT